VTAHPFIPLAFLLPRWLLDVLTALVDGACSLWDDEEAA
jgi:hypothetical protein